MITLELHDASATLRCLGDDGCGAIVAAGEEQRHRDWHLGLNAQGEALSGGQRREVVGLVRTESGWRAAGTHTDG